MRKDFTVNLFCNLYTILLCIALTACNNGSAEKSPSLSSSVVAPVNFQAHAGYPAVTLTWDAVAGVEQYNLYLATQPGVNPTNWNLLTDGAVIRDVKSPYRHMRIYKDVIYYYVVTAEKNGVESAPSAEVSDPNTYIFDDFERSDQLQAGTAPTGQVWSASGPGSLTYGIVGGRMVTVQNVYPRLDYPHHNFRFGAKFSFVNPSSSNCSIVLIADGSPVEAALRDMVHLQLRDIGWGLIYRADVRTTDVAVNGDTVFSYPFNPLTTQAADLIVRVNNSVKVLNVDYVVTGISNVAGGAVVFSQPMSGGETVEIRSPGPFENIVGGSYMLATDGTVYNAAITIVDDTATLELPDGTVQQAKDSRIQGITGNTLLWQLTGSGCRNESVFAAPVTN